MTRLHTALRQGRKHQQKRYETETCTMLGITRLEMRRTLRECFGRQITPEEHREIAIRQLARKLRISQREASRAFRLFSHALRQAGRALARVASAWKSDLKKVGL